MALPPWHEQDSTFYEEVLFEYNGESFVFKIEDAIANWDAVQDAFSESNLSRVLSIGNNVNSGGLRFDAFDCHEVVRVSSQMKTIISFNSTEVCPELQVKNTHVSSRL